MNVVRIFAAHLKAQDILRFSPIFFILGTPEPGQLLHMGREGLKPLAHTYPATSLNAT